MSKKMLVFYPVGQKFHTIYDSTIGLLEKEYNTIYSPPKRAFFYRIKNNIILRKIYYLFINPLRKFLIRIKKSNLALKFNRKKTLFFCFNSFPPEGFDFILDLEIITGLSGYNYFKLDKEYIIRRLKDSTCKKIICWNKASYISLTNTIDCSKFKKKIKIIPFGDKPSKLNKINKKKINLLFVSSINNPGGFEAKGGIIALESYSKIANKFKDVNFWVRADVKKEVIKKYKNVRGLTFFSGYLPEDKMKELFLKSDILLEPIPGIALILECMKFKLPIICFDFWCIPEMVRDGKNGFLIESSSIFGNLKDTRTYLKEMGSNYSKLSKREYYDPLLNGFIKKLEYLIENRYSLKKMSENQKKFLIKGGEYSLDKRNASLLRIIDPIMKN